MERCVCVNAPIVGLCFRFLCVQTACMLICRLRVCMCVQRCESVIYCYKDYYSGEERLLDLLENWSENVLKIADNLLVELFFDE